MEPLGACILGRILGCFFKLFVSPIGKRHHREKLHTRGTMVRALTLAEPSRDFAQGLDEHGHVNRQTDRKSQQRRIENCAVLSE